MNISTIIEQAVTEWLKAPETPTAQDICSGWCCDFADPIYFAYRDKGVEIMALDSVEDAVAFCIDSPAVLEALRVGFLSHTFLRYVGKYYDAETPEGVSHPLLLPTYSRALVEGHEAGFIDRGLFDQSQAYVRMIGS